MSTRHELRLDIHDALCGGPEEFFDHHLSHDGVLDRVIPVVDAYVAEKLAEPTSRLEALREYATNGHWQGLLTSRSVLEILDGEESL